jgi:hypothetical protein
LGELPQKSHTSLILSALGRNFFRHLHQFQSGFLLAIRLPKENTMEQWLNALPALAYVKYLHSWLVVNHNSEPISWTDDAVEVAWLAEWVSGKCGNAKSETKSVAANTAKRQRKLLSERRTRLAVVI